MTVTGCGHVIVTGVRSTGGVGRAGLPQDKKPSAPATLTSAAARTRKKKVRRFNSYRPRLSVATSTGQAERVDQKRNTPPAGPGNGMTTTFERSLSAVPLLLRASPAVTRKPTCSPGAG